MPEFYADLDAWARRQEQRARLAEKNAVRAARRAAQRSRAEVVLSIQGKRGVPAVVDTGAMARSVRVTPFDKGAVLEVTAPYAIYQEAGTKPYTPPWSVLLAWATRKTRGAPLPSLERSQRENRTRTRSVRRPMTRPLAAPSRSRRPSSRKRPSKRQQAAQALAGAAFNAIRTRGIKPKRFYSQVSPLFRVYARQESEKANARTLGGTVGG